MYTYVCIYIYIYNPQPRATVSSRPIWDGPLAWPTRCRAEGAGKNNIKARDICICMYVYIYIYNPQPRATVSGRPLRDDPLAWPARCRAEGAGKDNIKATDICICMYVYIYIYIIHSLAPPLPVALYGTTLSPGPLAAGQKVRARTT